MNILITGSSGFIGNKIKKYFKNKGHTIFTLSRNSNKRNENYSSENIIGLHELKEIVIDLDIIIHLSSKSHSNKFSFQNQKENYFITKSLIEFAKKIKLKKFIFLSSTNVNGEYSDKNIISEKSIPNPISLYAKSKLELEQLIQNEFRNSLIEYYNIRVPLVIGENAKGNLKSLMYLAKFNVPLPIKGINNKRSFISIIDIIKIFENIIELKKNKSGLYLAANNQSLSLYSLYNHINSSFRSNNNTFYLNKNLLKLIFIIIGKENSFIKIFYSFEIDNSKLFKELDFNSFSDITKEINKMVESFKNKDE